MTLASCSSSGATGGESGGEPQSGGTLAYGMTGETQSMDPANCGLVAYHRCAPVFGTLMRYDAEAGKFTPYMAESFESSDGKNWTLKLRPGVEFSDGTPFDADAVVFNWDRIKDPATLSPVASVTQGMTWEAVDPLTVNMTVEQANFQLPWQLVRGMGAIGSPTAIAAAGAEVGSKPVGAGPFIMKEWVRNSEMQLVRNPTYFEENLPYLDALTVKLISSEEQKMNAVISGEVLMTPLSSALDIQKMEDNGFNSYESEVIGGSGVIFNYKDASLQDEGLRSALLAAIDADQMVAALGTQTTTAKAYLPTDTAAAYPKLDLTEAQKKFDDYLTRSGKTSENLTLTTYAGFPVMEQTSQMLQAQLQKIKGLTVKIEPLDAPVLLGKQRQGEYQLLTTTYMSPSRDLMYDLFHTDGPQNATGYSNPKVDEALELTRSSNDKAEVDAAYEVANFEVSRDAPVRNWQYIGSYLTADTSVHGVHIVSTGSGAAWDFEKVWLN
ncbi:ABC transporter substrate-binding protein [Tomitella biformata]|uniref:ABC transporter substrate-binding protein n=1 Tax=Tomitella biformata TaxID=630403 RepID=UPI00130E20C1|nr:ABC transporter substrate-binding protein [Tomitella biformata]